MVAAGDSIGGGSGSARPTAVSGHGQRADPLCISLDGFDAQPDDNPAVRVVLERRGEIAFDGDAVPYPR